MKVMPPCLAGTDLPAPEHTLQGSTDLSRGAAERRFVLKPLFREIGRAHV